MLMRDAFVAAMIGVPFVTYRARCPRCADAIGYIDTSKMQKYQKRILTAGLESCRRYRLQLNEQITPAA